MPKKIERVANKYDLSPNELEEKHRCGQGLRQISKYWNKLVVQKAVQQQGAYLTDSEAEIIVEALNRKNDKILDSVDARNQLRSHGVNVDEVVSDFISYQTVRHHLHECGVDTSKSHEVRPGKELDTVLRLKHRLEKVCNKSVQRLNREGYIRIADPSVSATITIKCGACGRERMLPNGIIEGVSCTCSR